MLKWVINIFSKILKYFSFGDIIFFISILLIGGFNEFVACILSLILTGYLFLKLKKTKRLSIKINTLSVSIGLICLMYGITVLWSVDRGMAFIGFLKFLPLLLFLITVWQSEKINFEIWLPYFSAIMVLISTLGMHIPFTASFFSVANRLAGFFQYPNTFALFLLVSELILIKKDKLHICDYVCLAILIFGLLYTGSRTAFIIAVVANLAMIVYKFKQSSKRKTFFIAISVFIGVCVATFLTIFILNPDILTRYLSIKLTESTFVGRILYWVDALPLLLKYPFGMGYLGYNYIQGTVQTGWYSVRFVHNDFLQLCLDVGITPTVFFIFAVAKSIFKKGTPFYKRIVVISICAHSFFDFDLQFLSVFFMLLLLLDHSSGKTVIFKKDKRALNCILVFLFVINAYMGTHLTLAYFNQNKTADAIYPYNTDVKIAMLEVESDLAQANAIADRILNQNTVSPIPYSVKAKYYYSIGDFNSLISTKRTIFNLDPFEYTEYEEYCQMLINGISLYQKTGDTESIKYCQQELVSIKNTLEQNISSLSALGAKIDDQPQSQLPEEILYYIAEIEKE